MTTPIAICHNRVCADCGQPENECALEITEQDKLVCCDCLYPENQNDETVSVVSEDDDEVIACANCRVSGLKTDFREGSDDKLRCKDCDWSLGSDTEEEDDDDETVSVIGDLCECCGRPYDDRNPLRQSEMCDCVQNDDGTLSRPEVSICEACGVPETDECRPDCAYQARRQKEEEEEHRNQLIAQITHFISQIPEAEKNRKGDWDVAGKDLY